MEIYEPKYLEVPGSHRKIGKSSQGFTLFRRPMGKVYAHLINVLDASALVGRDLELAVRLGEAPHTSQVKTESGEDLGRSPRLLATDIKIEVI